MTGTKKKELSKAQRESLIKTASYASLTMAISLVALKVWGWRATDSIALLSSLADSVLDVLASGVTFWAVRYSLSPADAEHRFGHGKSEGLAALLQALIIAASATYVGFEAVKRFMLPQAIKAPELGLSVMLIAMAATILLVGFQRYVGRRAGSVAISADAVHYQSDVLVNLGVGLAIVITSWTSWALVDPVVGLVIALFILRSAWGIGRRSLEILLDHEIPIVDRQKIRQISLEHPEVLGFHDMKTRFGGNHYIVQFHLELEPDISLLRSHAILDDVEDTILSLYPRCEIIIHADPLGVHERRDRFE
ncbi:MAG: cation diffusion facilitator family transporter [Gammaproteobacteria bacterium]|nr:cation diffusion facilitator family transporter [Gammaproteobacteria bacterium]